MLTEMIILLFAGFLGFNFKLMLKNYIAEHHIDISSSRTEIFNRNV